MTKKCKKKKNDLGTILEGKCQIPVPFFFQNAVKQLAIFNINGQTEKKE